jgi:hypothetical protein
VNIKVMDVIVYQDQWRWTTDKIVHPSWAQIETAIRHLDKYHHPSVFLWPTEDETKHQLEPDSGCFEVIGGEGEYWLALSWGQYFERRYRNPQGTVQDVAVWTSDQGFITEDRFVCRDLERVVNAVRYHHDHGGFDPMLTWE